MGIYSTAHPVENCASGAWFLRIKRDISLDSNMKVIHYVVHTMLRKKSQTVFGDTSLSVPVKRTSARSTQKERCLLNSQYTLVHFVYILCSSCYCYVKESERLLMAS